MIATVVFLKQNAATQSDAMGQARSDCSTSTGFVFEQESKLPSSFVGLWGQLQGNWVLHWGLLLSPKMSNTPCKARHLSTYCRAQARCSPCPESGSNRSKVSDAFLCIWPSSTVGITAKQAGLQAAYLSTRTVSVGSFHHAVQWSGSEHERWMRACRLDVS